MSHRVKNSTTKLFQRPLPAAMGFIKMKTARRRQLVSCVSYAMTGIVYAVVAGGLLSSPRLLRGLLQLDEVSLDALPFAPPNPSVPQSLRGLWWIDNGAGAVTVDLNRLRRDRRGQGFHVDDAAKNYQSVSNNLSGLRFCAVGSFLILSPCGCRLRQA